MTKYIRICIASALFSLGAAMQAAMPKIANSMKGRPKNVLFLVVDDLRTQLNVSYGQSYMITPNLDKLATGGIVFDHAFVQYAWCSPSRNSFMSGRYPDTQEVWNSGKSFRGKHRDFIRGIPPDLSTMPIPHYFKEHGYLSLGGGKIYHKNAPENDDIPHSWSEDISYFEFNEKDSCPGGENKVGCGGCPHQLPDEEFYDWKLANHTIHSLRYAARAEKPFFIAAGFRRPHTPWFINQRFVDMYGEVSPPKFRYFRKDAPECAFVCGGDGVGCDFNISTPRTSAAASLCRKTYYAAVTATDHYIGLILDELEALGLENDTAVVMFGDHGWHLGEGNQWAKYTNMEFGTRTPLILRAPWLLHPGRTPIFTELVDLYPTLAELVGLPAPEQVDGRSLVPALTGKTTDTLKNSAISQMARCCPKDVAIGPKCGMCSHDPSEDISFMGYAVRTLEWRYVAWYKWDGINLRPRCDGNLGEELYPHDGDNGDDFESVFELSNLAVWDKHADAVSQMRKLLFSRFPKAFGNCMAETSTPTPNKTFEVYTAEGRKIDVHHSISR